MADKFKLIPSNFNIPLISDQQKPIPIPYQLTGRAVTAPVPFKYFCIIYWDLVECIHSKKQKQNNTIPYKNIERHTVRTIVSWPNPKQWVIVHTSDLMMIIRQSIYILSIITREMDTLKIHSPTYCIMFNWENMLNLTHTLDKIYLTGIL